LGTVGFPISKGPFENPNYFFCVYGLKKQKKTRKMSDNRTYLGVTHKEIRKRDDFEEALQAAYGSKSATADAKTSDSIWFGMSQQSMYYVYKNQSGVYYVFDFGLSISQGPNGAVPKAVYEHKPLPAMIDDISNKLPEYFLLSDRVSSVTKDMGTIAMLQPLQESYVALYMANGKYKLYSASTNVFLNTSVTSGAATGGGATGGRAA
jgi:hypothetical protein